MLGKTNIRTLSEGAIVTEIEDYKWVQMQSGVYGNFVKAIYKNNYLTAITADGTVVYTTDGEVWQTSVVEYEDCRINDIYWDGSRFLLVGSYTKTVESLEINLRMGLILSTMDFSLYEQINIPEENNFLNNTNTSYNWVEEYLGIYMENSRYFALSISNIGEWNSTQRKMTVKTIYIRRYIGDLQSKWESEISVIFTEINPLRSVAKNLNKFIISCSGSYRTNTSVTYREAVYIFTGYEYKTVSLKNLHSNILIPVFECKNELYSMYLYSSNNYALTKVIETDEQIVLSQNINYGFVDGIYFNNCQIFINNHEMLIVKKGESFADKTLDDLIEIAPELTMNCITKAFGQLYIFGNQGAILKSSVETNNENAVAVQTLSAKKALADAKAYSDERYAELEARIIALEAGQIPE